MTPIIFWGATGHAKVLREALDATCQKLVAIFDNRDIPSPFIDVPVFSGEAGFAEWERTYLGQQPVQACVAIGGANGRDRLAILGWLADRGYAPHTVLHPLAFVAKDAELGLGCQAMALSAICASARIGTGVIVNTRSSVDHDCTIGDGAHIGPGATLAGQVVVGNFAFVGAGAVILPNIRIGEGATVGAGAVVTRNVAAGQTVVGNPARLHV